MKSNSIKSILLLCFSLLSFVSCKNDSNTTKQDVRDSSNMIEEDVESADEIVTVVANYKTKGGLINNLINLSTRCTYKNGNLVKEVSTTNSGGMNMEVTQEFDDKQRLSMLKSVMNGERSVLEYNTYTEDDLLLTEKRIEKNGAAYDTTLLEFFYPEDRSNPMEYYSTRNGEKIKVMTLTKTGNKEVLEERSFSKENDFGFNTIYRTRNDDGDILEESSKYIRADWSDKTKMDTTITEPVMYEYDDNGRVIRMESYGALTVNGVLENEYTEEGVLKKRTIKKKGESKKVIKFREVRN